MNTLPLQAKVVFRADHGTNSTFCTFFRVKIIRLIYTERKSAGDISIMTTAPIDINKRWIASLHESIDQLDQNLKLRIMKPVGKKCALDILSLCEEYNGKEVETIEELVSGWNTLRDKRNLKGGWKFERNFVRGIFGECACLLVLSGLIELHPIQCYCSQGMMESISSKVANRSIEVEIKQSIGRGDAVCEFLIKL